MLLSEHPREFVPQTGLTVMKNTQFNAYFKEKMRMEWPLFRKTWSMNEESHRLLAFVPFSISKEVDDVIVFPFIVNTGAAPGTIYLGKQKKYIQNREVAGGCKAIFLGGNNAVIQSNCQHAARSI